MNRKVQASSTAKLIGSRMRSLIYVGLLCVTLIVGGFIAYVAIPSTAAKVQQLPLNLVAWDSGRYVQLNWDGDFTGIVRGYNVYRALKTTDRWEKLNKTPYPATTFVDYSAPRAEIVFYRINSITENGEEIPTDIFTEINTSATSALNRPEALLAYDKNNIITDQQLVNAGAMNAVQIQSFLASQGSVLATYSSGGKTAAQRIYDDCQTHGISPHVVLVTLQKEKGLIRSGTANPNSFAMGWNTGDSSTSNFADQIYWGTRQFKLYYNNLGNYGWIVGQPHNVSDGTVTAANITTAGLYIYTPWIGQGGGGQPGIGGNYLFWDLWYNTFAFDSSSSPSSVSDGFDYPVGKPDGIGWLNNNNGLGFLESYNYGGSCGLTYHPGKDFNKDGTSGDQDRYEPVYAASNGIVIDSAYYGTSTWGNVILIEHTLPDGSKVWSQYGHLENRLVQTGAVVAKGDQIGRVGKGDGTLSAHLHFEIRKVLLAASAFPCGQPQQYVLDRYYDPIAYINSHRSVCGSGSSENYRVLGNRPPIHPNGTLIKANGSPTVYLIREGKKWWVTSPSVLAFLYQQPNSDFSNDVITVASDEISRYPTNPDPVSNALPSNGRTQPDGRLIQQGGEISIVTNGGQRRAFATSAAFTGLGYQFCKAISVSDYSSYPAGPAAEVMLLITSNLALNPSGPYTTSQSINAQFTITNIGSFSTTLDTLTVGGRLNQTVTDFPFQNSVTLNAGQSHPYSGSRSFTSPGTYNFFTAYKDSAGTWNTNIPADPGIITTTNIVVSSCNTPGAFSLSSPSNGQSLGATSSVTLNWQASANADSYDVYFGTSATPPFIANQTGTSRSVSVTPGQTYFWRIVARVNCNSSLTATTATWSFSVQQACNAPGAFSLSSPSNGQSLGATSSVTLNWQASANADSYDVYFGTSATPPFIANQTGTSRSVSVTPGQTYFWRIVARVNCNSSLTATTATWSFSITANDPCNTVVPISFGQTLTGQLSNGDCTLSDGSYIDLYSFNATAGQQIAINLNSTAFDAYLLLIDPNNNLIAQDNNGGGGTNARIPAGSGYLSLPVTGSYTILANSLQAGETGSYSLTLSASVGGACPAVTNVNPVLAGVGAVVRINGADLSGVTSVRFSNNVNAVITGNTGTQITVNVPVGAVTGPITLSQTGCSDVQTASITICTNSPTTLAVDDGSAESSFGFDPIVTTPYFVNRLTPTSYPATLSEVVANIILPVGTPIEILVGNNADGDTNINGTSFQVTNTTVSAQGTYANYGINPITISSGDFVVGFRYTNAPNLFPASFDNDAPSGSRSYFSTDGTAFYLLTFNNIPVDLLIRATVYNGGCGGTCQTITLNPTNPILPSGNIGLFYTQSFSQTGGTGTVNWSISAGTIPSNLTLNPITGLLSGTPMQSGTFNFTVKATDTNGCMGTRAYTLNVNGSNPNGLQFYSLPRPIRLFDTRAPIPGTPACQYLSQALVANTELVRNAIVTCDGSVIPANAAAIVGTATVINPLNNGYITLWPDGQQRPPVSNLNFTTSQSVANAITVGLSGTGNFRIYSPASTDLYVDITGYYAPPSPSGLYYHPLPKPIRLFDTRAPIPGFQPCEYLNQPLIAGVELVKQARINCDGLTIPADAMAIVGNATVVSPSGSGFITMWQDGIVRPIVTNLSYVTGQIVPDAFTIGLGSNGQFRVYSPTNTNFIVDITGYYSPSASDLNGNGLLYSPLPKPIRLFDTRAAIPGFPACEYLNQPLGGNSELVKSGYITCNGVTIPTNAEAIVGNATVVTPILGGYATLWPDGQVRPPVSNLNFVAGQIVPNAFSVGLSGLGGFRVYSSATTHFIVDVTGFFAP